MLSVDQELGRVDDVQVWDVGQIVSKLHVDAHHSAIPGVHQNVGEEEYQVWRVGDRAADLVANSDADEDTEVDIDQPDFLVGDGVVEVETGELDDVSPPEALDGQTVGVCLAGV